MVWLSVWNEVQSCTWPSWCRCYSLSLVLVKSRLVLLFWYWLIRVVTNKGPLNGCVCVCVKSVRHSSATDKLNKPVTCHSKLSCCYIRTRYLRKQWLSMLFVGIFAAVNSDIMYLISQSCVTLLLWLVWFIFYCWTCKCFVTTTHPVGLQGHCVLKCLSVCASVLACVVDTFYVRCAIDF